MLFGADIAQRNFRSSAAKEFHPGGFSLLAMNLITIEIR